MIFCIRCYHQRGAMIEAIFIYNGFAVCKSCIRDIEKIETTKPLWWNKTIQWGMNLK